MEWELHLSEADNTECVVGVHPDNWIEIPIVGPAGACCTKARATCGLASKRADRRDMTCIRLVGKLVDDYNAIISRRLDEEMREHECRQP
jgi:hypothetical protein